MDQYLVIGNDGKEYGPVDLPGLLGWVRQSRVLAATLVRKNDQPPVAAESLPELAVAFAPAPPSAVPPFVTTAPLPAAFKSWSFIGQAWDLVKPHWLPLSAMFFLLTAIGAVPYIGGCVFFIVGGALYVGVNRAILGMMAGRPPDVGMMFQGFDRFGQAFLAMLVMMLLAVACCVVVAGPAAAFVLVTGEGIHSGSAVVAAMLAGTVAIVLCAILAIMWIFVYLVIAETNLGFWQAMQASMSLTAGHRWQVFCLLLACAVVGILGFLACFVGIFIAQPVIYTAVALAYRFLQAKQARQAGQEAPASPTA